MLEAEHIHQLFYFRDSSSRTSSPQQRQGRMPTCTRLLVTTSCRVTNKCKQHKQPEIRAKVKLSNWRFNVNLVIVTWKVNTRGCQKVERWMRKCTEQWVHLRRTMHGRANHSWEPQQNLTWFPLRISNSSDFYPLWFFDLLYFFTMNTHYFFSFLGWYWGLNSVSTPWATCQPYVCDGFFQDRVSWIICPGWLQTMIFLISASWVAGTTGAWHVISMMERNCDGYTKWTNAECSG
jgi:hypothetical protein